MTDMMVPAELKVEALTWTQRAKALKIVDDESFSGSTDLLKGIKGLRAKIDATFDPVIEAAHKAHKAALAAKKEHEEPLAEAEKIIKTSMRAYRLEQERKALEERLRLEAEARKREEEARLLEAQSLEDAGLDDEAAALLDAPMSARVIWQPPPTPKVNGVSFATTYSAEVTDMLALVRYVHSHPEMVHLLMQNQPALNSMARSQRDAFSIPGCRLVKSQNVRSST